MRPRRIELTRRALRAEEEHLILVLVEVAREICAPARMTDSCFATKSGYPPLAGNNTSCGGGRKRGEVPPTTSSPDLKATASGGLALAAEKSSETVARLLSPVVL